MLKFALAIYERYFIACSVILIIGKAYQHLHLLDGSIKNYAQKGLQTPGDEVNRQRRHLRSQPSDAL